MKKLVCFPSDPLDAYRKQGSTNEYLEGYYNPGAYFDEVYLLGPWRTSENKFGRIQYIQSTPIHFKQIIKDIAPQVVRGYGGYFPADWVACSKVDGIPTLISVHDTNTDLLFESVQYADAVICMADIVRKVVLENIPIDQDKVWVMPNRIDTTVFKRTINVSYFQRLNERFGQGKHILHVGRKTRQKNLDTLIKALKYLDDNHKCIFVGAGDTTEYEILAKNEDVADRCFFVERVSHNTLPLWYSWCDCMCTPSRWEGFGFVFIEAAACESLVITSNIAPMNEYLTNNENAYLVNEYENPKILADTILKAEEDNEKNQCIKKNARNVGLHFDKKKVDKLEIESYEKVIRMKANNRGISPLLIEQKYRNFR